MKIPAENRGVGLLFIRVNSENTLSRLSAWVILCAQVLNKKCFRNNKFW